MRSFSINDSWRREDDPGASPWAFQWLERGVEASKRKPGECDVMDPVKGGFLRKRVVSWVKYC